MANFRRGITLIKLARFFSQINLVINSEAPNKSEVSCTQGSVMKEQTDEQSKSNITSQLFHWAIQSNFNGSNIFGIM